MLLFSRTDTSVFGRWWWTVDRWLVAALGLLMLFGGLMVTTASPAVAERIGAPDTYFITRHLIFLLLSAGLMLALSMLQPRQILLLAGAAFLLGLFAMVLVVGSPLGLDIKGAKRWIRLPGLGSLQPSEFVKPAFIILNAWLLAHPSVRSGFGTKLLPLLLLGIVVGLLMLQPDFGMTAVVTFIWIAQIFLAGLPLYLVVFGGVACVLGSIGVYLTFPHVSSRIDRFLDPASGDTYQVDRAMEAFRSGGMFGVGPGQGVIKDQIPDAHADFIFAVAGEELGLLWCLIILGLIAFIVLRGFYRSGQGPTLFVTLASAGLLVQFALQSLVNISSSLHLIPTKGMTLPFVSYGGSSLLATALGMGMLLALTRRRTHAP